jgi:polyphenol oxidase
MNFHRKGPLLYLTFTQLDRYPKVVHAVFTRVGGMSREPETGLNVGINCGDDPSAVADNRRLISECIGHRDLFFLSQKHGTDVVLTQSDATSDDRGNPFEADAAVSSRAGRMLVIQAADCQSVMLHDPVNGAVANIHAGWRGSVGNIIEKCIGAMTHHFKTEPANLIAGIGPSLGPCCAEFIHYRQEIPENLHRYKDDRDRFNFWQISHDQMTSCGLQAENIEWSNICTKCNPHLFYSYRHSTHTGRFASVIGMA